MDRFRLLIPSRKPSHLRTSSTPVEETLVPTTDVIAEICPRFRILIVGRSGVGKSSLINAIFKASVAEVEHDKAGAADIYKGVTSPYNKHLILHDSQGYEPGDKGEFDILEKFITEQTEKQSPTERLHAIWLCIPMSYSGGRLFEAGEEKIFKLNRNKVPIIVVITKFDLYMVGLLKRGRLKGPKFSQAAEQLFMQTYGHKFEKGGVGQDRPMPYALVSSRLQPHIHTLQRLVQITMKHIGVESMGPTSGLAYGSDENQSESAQIALATAQRVDMAGKIEASIKVGKEKYWQAIASGTHFYNTSLEDCSSVIHKDIVTIWNFRDLNEFLLSDAFRRQIMVIVEDLTDTDTMQSKVTVASAQAGLSKLWTTAVYKSGPEHIRCLMGYVVDLTLILQAMFQVSLQDTEAGSVMVDHIDEILYAFHSSEKKISIHQEIRMFTRRSFAKGIVVEKIQSLLEGNQVTQTETQLIKDKPPFQSLLTILRFELTANGLVVNRIILDLLCELLELPRFRGIVPRMLPSDIELLLDFILYLLQNDHLLACGVPDANRMARKLMAKLVSKANVMPQSLYITNVSFDAHSPIAALGGHGCVLKGKYKADAVALKMLDNFNKGQKDAPLRKHLYQELLDWRSLAHRFILPLLGVFEQESHVFLVSPLMVNGTLASWRINQTPIVAEIHRVMVEVAEGVQYIHSEGIAHGNLHGGNVLLDPGFHCQIADIGVIRHRDATTPLMSNFAAPELLEGVERETMQMDVYAFGCLHYAMFFGTLPFQEENRLQIHRLIARGARPTRLNSPVMDDGIWNLIEQCWMRNPSERPTMEQIVETYVSFLATLPSLLTTLRELAAGGGSIVNDLTHRLMRRLLEQYESDTIASELTTTSDVGLFLDFALRLLHDGSLSDSGIQDANRKARNLLFGLIEKRGIMPKSLFITGITTTTNLGTIGFQGEHDSKQVMLQIMYKVHEDDLLRNRFYHEALVWRSLAHRFVLPLLGVFEEESQLFLSSTLMINGTLTEWRKNWKPDVIEIHRMMQKIAEGIQYVHSEGIVHGDLRGENIFIDSSFNCQIANIGLTRHSDNIQSSMLNFAAPELFFTSNKRDRPDSDEGSNYIIQGSKTRQTDVYSFGCLCYAIFFDTVPFQDLRGPQILQQVINGKRPVRRDIPPIDDGVWNVIQDCWLQDASRRPMMKQIVKAGMMFTSLPLLLASLSELTASGSSMVNENTVRLICELLDLPEYDVMDTKSKNESDAELLLAFVVDLLREGSLVNCGIPDANRKARKLMHRMISANVMPKFLFINDVRTTFDTIGMGGYGRVFRGKYKGQPVALKVVDKGRKEGSLRQDFCREALSWRSLVHCFILPLLGIFEDRSQLYLVSPFMTNGTLSEWRKKQTPHVAELHRLLLEVARGVHYIHSKGIVHGDLHGGNVLLDSDLHCQITDFGSTRHAEATVTRTTTALSLSFAAPELFGVCIECGQSDCDGCYEGYEKHHACKTTETDVYAFGCLYYAVFFDTVPFHGINDFQIVRLVMDGKRPGRLEMPKMEDNTWNLIQNCWETIPSKRQTMEEIVAASTPLPGT